MQVIGSKPYASESFPAKKPNFYMVGWTVSWAGIWKLVTRTSTDFVTWGNEIEHSITWSGIVDADEKRNPYFMQIGNTEEIWMFIEIVEDTAGAQELSNIWYNISTDYGETWSAGVKVTAYDSFTAIAEHPQAVQKHKDNIYLIYNEFRNALTMDNTASGWCAGGLDIIPTDMHWDAVADKWYVTNVYTGGGTKRFHAVIEVDIESWTITDCWSTSSVPAFDAFLDSEHSWYAAFENERPYIVVGSVGVVNELYHLEVLNYVDDTITQYNFLDWPAYGLTKNVTWTDHDPIRPERGVATVWIDAAAHRMWMGYYVSSNVGVTFGYIDLQESGPDYTFHEVFHSTATFSWGLHLTLNPAEDGGASFHKDFDMIVISECSESFQDLEMAIFSMSDGGRTHNYKRTTHASFPNHGLFRKRHMRTENGQTILYSGFHYESGFGQTNFRGLFRLNLDTDEMTYIRPTTHTEDDYDIRGIIEIPDNKLLMSAFGTGNGGILLYDIDSGAWIKYNNTNSPGLTGDGLNEMAWPIAYDPSRGMILTGASNSPATNWTGLSAISQFGALRRANYMLGTNSGGWSFATATPLVQGINDYDAHAVVDPDSNGLIAFWVNDTLQALSIKWDLEQGDTNLDPYLLRDREIVMERFIDGTPSRLTFQVSHGHLFDKHNINSVMSQVLTKLKSITLRFGEKSASIDYWMNQGTFIIVETSISYERGEYPVMTVVCEDKMSTWDDQLILATDEYFDIEPDAALDDIVESHTDFTVNTIDTPAMNNTEKIHYQWIEMVVLDIVLQLVNRFGYYPRIDMDGKFNIKEISESANTAQSYQDASQIINFTPDDTFSDFTNKVIVSGEEMDWNEVVYNEERIGIHDGTVGWWGGKETHKMYYSEDKHRTCRNPRLVVLKTVSTIGFKVAEVFGGDIDEGIEDVDGDEKWVETFIDVPNLVPMLGAAISVIGGALWKGNINIHPHGGGGHTPSIPIGRVVFGGGVLAALNILGSVVNYQHEIWAQPIGQIRRSIQATADDVLAQAEMGYEVVKKFDDPLCNTVAGCQFVADFELMVARLQRNRVKFTKVANLNDEDGDTIEIFHPHTGLPIKIFITQLKRRMVIAGVSDGHFFDDIEGWVVT